MRRPTAALLAAALLLAACSTIPSSGEVREASGEDQPEREQVYVPPGPADGASPQQVVTGFIEAMQAEPVSTDVASKFLVPGAAEAWRPGLATVIYDRFAATESGTRVTLTLRPVAQLDARGVYAPAAVSAVDREYVFSLRLVDGEWRIVNPPDTTYVPLTFFDRVYLPVSLYFFDHSEQVLVPEPVYLPQGDQLATALVRGVLAGPSGRLSSELHTAAPQETQLEVSVPVREGVAEVRLVEGLVLAPPQAELLAAQIVAALRQVADVTGVRISSGDVVLDVPRADAVLSISMGDRFDPVELLFPGQLYALQRGRLVAVSESGADRLDGYWGSRDRGIGSFDVNLGLSRLGAISRGSVLVGDLDAVPTPNNRPATWLSGGNDLLGPVWDRAQRLWVVDRDGNSSRVLVLDGRHARRVDIGDLADERIVSFALSPDGIRFAGLIEARPGRPARVVVGLVSRAGNGVRVRALTRVSPLPLESGITSVIDIGWYDPTTVALLAREGGASPQPYLVRIDGSRTEGGLTSGSPQLGPVGVDEVVVSGNPADVLMVGDRRGRLWYRGPDENWTRVPDTGLRFPTYPG